MLAERGVRQWAVSVLAAVVGLSGVLAAVVLPFAPVIADEATVTWPAAGKPLIPSTALFVPYRPAQLTASLSCRVFSHVDAGRVVLATGPLGDGLVVREGVSGPEVVLRDRIVPLQRMADDCRATINADRDGVTVSDGVKAPIELPGEPVPEVFFFHTDLDPANAAGLTVIARTASVFATTPSTVKGIVIAVQLLAATIALVILTRRARSRRPSRPNWRLACVDAVVIAVLIGWAIIGPLAVDDGWATTIARTYATTGEAGNYYRWWNASETPFALWEQLLAPLTSVSLQPLWLRLPSTLLAGATWFVLTRGVLGAALPARSGTIKVRLLAAVCLLAAWLPFNLGTRPESYVALGVTSLLAILWRARGPAALCWAALVVAVTVPISPTSVVVGAPLIVFAPRIVRALRTASRGKVEVALRLLLLCCVACVAMTIVFADSTWDALATATDWHNFFGPSLPWYREPERYEYLFSADQQGSFAKRMPVVLVVAMLPLVALMNARTAQRTRVSCAAARLATVVVGALVLLCLVPSKWSYHLGAMAGLFAAFLVVAIVMVVEQARAAEASRTSSAIGLAGGLFVAIAAALAFRGPNAWWLQPLYYVPWATGSIRPKGVPLGSAVLWASVLVVVIVISAAFANGPAGTRIGRAFIAGPATLAVFVAGMAVAILLVSFVAAPLRRPAGSLAVANLRWLTGRQACGLADDVEVLQDGAILSAATPAPSLTGFVPGGGFSPDSPPPSPPGTGMFTYLWGSRDAGSRMAAAMTSPWFALPVLGPHEGLTISVSGRIGGENTVVFEFGQAQGTDTVRALSEVVLTDAPRRVEDPDLPAWRVITLSTERIPHSANLIRIRAVSGATDWLAFTGPRRYSVVGLSTFLTGHGPVLVDWPLAFVFPCVRNIAAVSRGLAQAPRSTVVSPRPWRNIPTESIGATFTALNLSGRLYEVPTRLAGDTDIDWGTLLVSADPSDKDAYDVSIVRVRRPGHVPGQRVYQTELPK